MAKQRSLGPFSFPIETPPMAPSLIADRVTLLQKLSAVGSGILLASLAANIAFAWMATHRADVEPYVADGGVFGCKVRSHSGEGT